MRQIVELGEELRECGVAILAGFNRFLSTMCFLVERMSQIGSEVSSSSASSSRLFFSVLAAASVLELPICFNRAFDAFKT